MRLDDVVMSGDGYYQSTAYHAYLHLPSFEFWAQCIFCILSLAVCYVLAPRVARICVQRTMSTRLVRFVEDVGPSIIATGLMALFVGVCLLLEIPLHDQLVVWKVMSLTMWVLVVRLISWFLRVVMQPHELLSFMLRSIEWGVVMTMVMTFFGLLLPTIHLLDSIQFTVGAQVFRGTNIVGGVIVAVLALTVAGQLTQFLEWGLNRYSKRQHMMLNDALILSRMISLTIFMLTIIGVLIGSGLDPATLTAFGGALGIGLGFGLQEVVVNFVSGVLLLFERAIKPGDYVTVGNITGQVVTLGHRSLVIRDVLGTENIIPNGILTRGTIQNHTLSNNDFRVCFLLRLGSITQFDQARVLIENVMRHHPRILQHQPFAVQISEIWENQIVLEISCWINDLNKGQKPLISDLLQRIGKDCAEQKVRLAHPSIALVASNS